MENSDRGQVNSSAAEVYEELMVPTIFQAWPKPVMDAANVEPGHRVLDVACGTGVLTRAVRDRVGPGGSVIGLDINEGMLAVATRKTPDIEWRQGRAEELPFETDSFDRVVSQFGMMFFTDRQAAVQEMIRVLRPGGRLAVAVWDKIEHSPGFEALANVLGAVLGDQAASAMHGPFVLGDVDELRSIFADAGIHDAEIRTHTGQVRFDSIDSWVYTETRGWVLADMIDGVQYERLLVEARRSLARFAQSDGSVVFDLPAHIVTADKR